MIPRIVGGQSGQIEQFKWQVALLYDSKHLCGATIISTTRILTAAHCTYKITNVSKIQVRAGSSHPDKDGVVKSVLKVVEHPNFNKPTTLNNDIAVVVLKEALQFGPTIGAAVLATEKDFLKPGALVTVSGYGSTTVSGNQATDLHFVTLPIVDQAVCVKAYKNFAKAKVTDNMICAGFYGTGGKDACQGDSGGCYFLSSRKRI